MAGALEQPLTFFDHRIRGVLGVPDDDEDGDPGTRLRPGRGGCRALMFSPSHGATLPRSRASGLARFGANPLLKAGINPARRPRRYSTNSKELYADMSYVERRGGASRTPSHAASVICPAAPLPAESNRDDLPVRLAAGATGPRQRSPIVAARPDLRGWRRSAGGGGVVAGGP